MSSTDTMFADTIYALATSPGKSGIGVIRLSGPQAKAALQRLTGLKEVMPRMAQYVAFRHPVTDLVIDRGLALYFNRPHSFTGEDVVECHVHGSLAVIRELLEVLSGMGLRPAEPGEFTRRAFTHGKMDLMEAEGLADLIDAETSQQKTQALRQMEGELSGYYERMRVQIIQSLAHLEAYIDFPDEEIPEEVLTGLSGQIRGLQWDITQALQDRKRGERVRDGINVVILGAPNAGKSSLLNAIAKRDVAIVSYQAGTTRDAIEIHLDMAGYPVVLVDTAGLRESDEHIEREGIRRARARAAEADIRLVLFDGGEWPRMDSASETLIDDQALVVVSKCDILDAKAQSAIPASALAISTKTGEGMESLLAALEQRIVAYFSTGSAPFITRNRHRALLSEALKCLEKSLISMPLELKCEELRQAALMIGKITGKIQVDDILDVIFSSFCIGK